MQITSNDFEYSASISQDTNTIDVCAFRHGELTIALNTGFGAHKEITLSPDEARQLREHLNDPQTMAILGICDITDVKCPDCERMVSDFQRHSCTQ